MCLNAGTVKFLTIGTLSCMHKDFQLDIYYVYAILENFTFHSDLFSPSFNIFLERVTAQLADRDKAINFHLCL